MSIVPAPIDQLASSRTLTPYERVCRERDEERRRRMRAEAKLSALAALLQNPSLTHKQARTRAAAALALEAQRPVDEPSAEFQVDLGQIAKKAGLIPPTPAGDTDARDRAFRTGRKAAGLVLKELREVGAIAGHRVEKERVRGEVVSSSVVVRVALPHVDVIRAASQAGTRMLQNPRGAAKVVPRCPHCDSESTELRCRSCGAITDREDSAPTRSQVAVDRRGAA